MAEATPRQGSLLPRPPRAAPLKRMHVDDAGSFPDGSKAAAFLCARCGTRSDWQRIATVSEGKRGIPCPVCNKPLQSAVAWAEGGHRGA